MATIGDLKTDVAAHMLRDASAFVFGTRDQLLQAINHAKNWAQRAIDFELARVYAQVLNVSLANGGSLASATPFGGGGAIVLKSVKKTYLGATDGSQFPIDTISRQTWADRLEKRYEGMTTNQTQQVTTWQWQTPFVCVLYGNTFYIYPADTTAFGGSSTVNVYFDAVQWQADFTADANTHFLLDYCYDFMLLRSIYYLNHFIKEGPQVEISQKLLEEAWGNVVNWNATTQGNTVDTSLD